MYDVHIFDFQSITNKITFLRCYILIPAFYFSINHNQKIYFKAILINIIFCYIRYDLKKSETEQKRATDANIICHIQFTGQYYEYI